VKRLLGVLALAASAALAVLVLTRDPSEPLAVGAVIACAAVALAGLAGVVAVRLEEHAAALARPRRRRPAVARAVRRALEVGALVAALGLLRAIDGLTVITGGFVAAGLALAEVALSARREARSG
jgi:hypothetical protein